MSGNWNFPTVIGIILGSIGTFSGCYATYCLRKDRKIKLNVTLRTFNFQEQYDDVKGIRMIMIIENSGGLPVEVVEVGCIDKHKKDRIHFSDTITDQDKPLPLTIDPRKSIVVVSSKKDYDKAAKKDNYIAYVAITGGQLFTSSETILEVRSTPIEENIAIRVEDCIKKQDRPTKLKVKTIAECINKPNEPSDCYILVTVINIGNSSAFLSHLVFEISDQLANFRFDDPDCKGDSKWLDKLEPGDSRSAVIPIETFEDSDSNDIRAIVYTKDGYAFSCKC